MAINTSDLDELFAWMVKHKALVASDAKTGVSLTLSEQAFWGEAGPETSVERTMPSQPTETMHAKLRRLATQREAGLNE